MELGALTKWLASRMLVCVGRLLYTVLLEGYRKGDCVQVTNIRH
jgi:hypothetical protein